MFRYGRRRYVLSVGQLEWLCNLLSNVGIYPAFIRSKFGCFDSSPVRRPNLVYLVGPKPEYIAKAGPIISRLISETGWSTYAFANSKVTE